MVDTMITLHESTETSFTTNGLGTLSGAITCEVTEERNGEFELEIEYPVTGIRLVFDLDENGDYMTWAAQPKSGQSYLVKLLYERNGYTSNTVTYNADTINLGCDVDMHYYKLKNVSWENGSGITGTMRFVQVGGMNSDGTASNWSNNAYLQFERGVLVKAGWYDY